MSGESQESFYMHTQLKKLTLLLFLSVLLYSLTACDLASSIPLGSPSSTSSPSPSSGPGSANGWQRASPGVEIRTEDWKDTDGAEDTVSIVRFDLRHVHLQVAYQPAQPLSMSDWMQQEHATAIINGGYFDAQNVATALVISNGKVFGESYIGFGGMLSVDAQGHISLRSLHTQPYDPSSEQLRQAVQSSPMLVLGGKRTNFSANAASSPRSIVAMDKQGRLLFIVSPGQVFSLDEMADVLVSSDLSIQTALNLDGGASTGLYVNAGSQHITIDAFAKLPLVIVVR